MWSGVIVHENEFIIDGCNVKNRNGTDDLIPISLRRSCPTPDMCRSVRPLIKIAAHILILPPLNRNFHVQLPCTKFSTDENPHIATRPLNLDPLSEGASLSTEHKL
ncbi:hypothetical protein HNY73_013628 [Argiope bruennichi]|uniref:Uncharacterized protein n=1 Tax=Argiope bruennichi TaxID=94029 RepID=A0A8T0F0G0_ARGBR|nr:hypothetical protein HNY73_013628 [Argiope bruennichi]